MKMTKEDKIIDAQATGKLYDQQADTFAAWAPGLVWWETVGKPAYDHNLSEGFYGRDNVLVLDLGTASARVPQFLIENGVPAKNITGVEISPKQVEIARQRVPSYFYSGRHYRTYFIFAF